jgi:hypothetical protein
MVSRARVLLSWVIAYVAIQPICFLSHASSNLLYYLVRNNGGAINLTAVKKGLFSSMRCTYKLHSTPMYPGPASKGKRGIDGWKIKLSVMIYAGLFHRSFVCSIDASTSSTYPSSLRLLFRVVPCNYEAIIMIISWSTQKSEENYVDPGFGILLWSFLWPCRFWLRLITVGNNID